MKHQQIVLFLLFSACLTQSHPERPHNPTPHSADHYPVSTAFKNEPATSRFSLTVTPFQHHAPLQQQRFPHPEACIARIQSSARALETYQKISNIYLWINNINNRHLPVRIAARLLLLEAGLPIHFGKQLKKAQKKFAKKAADQAGNLLESLEDIDERLFKKFVESASLHVQIFQQHIDSIECCKKYHDNPPRRTESAAYVLNMIDHLSAWDFDKLTENYRQGLQHGGLVQQLYDYSTRERFNLSENQMIIQQDPVWQTASPEQRSNVQFQSHLLLRSLRAQRLQEYLGETVRFSSAAQQLIYAVVDQQADLSSMPAHYLEQMSNQLIEKILENPTECPVELQRLFFDNHGLLKKHSNTVFVEKYFSHDRLDLELKTAVNQALLIQKKQTSPEVRSLCQEVLYRAACSCWSRDPDVAVVHKKQAVELAEQLIQGAYPKADLTKITLAEIDQLRAAWERAEAESKKPVVVPTPVVPVFVSTIPAAPAIADNATAVPAKSGTTLADVGNYLFKYVEAVGLGLLDTAESLVGLVKGVITIIEDPQKCASDLGTSILNGVKQLGGYCYRLATGDPDTMGPHTLAWKFCQDALHAVSNLTGPELVRKATHFISQAILTRQIVGGAGALVRSAGSAVRNRLVCGVAVEGAAEIAPSFFNIVGRIKHNFLCKTGCSVFAAQVDQGVLKQLTIFSDSLDCRSFRLMNNPLGRAWNKNYTTVREAVAKAGLVGGTIVPEAEKVAGAVVLGGNAQTANPVTTLVSAAKKVAPPLQKRNVAAVVSAAKSAAQPIPASIKAPTQAPAAKSSIASAAQQAVPPAIRAAADKIKQEYLAKTYPMLSAADKATLQSTELGRSLAKLGESLQISEQFLEDAALIAAQGPELGFMFSHKAPVKVRIIHSSCTKLEFSSKNLCKPKIVGGHLNHDGFLQSSDGFTIKVTAEHRGCQLVYFQVGDQKGFPKTLYPAHWSAKMVYDKIREALKNTPFLTAQDGSIITSFAKFIESAATNRRWTAVGTTCDGFRIKMAIEYTDNVIEVVSGYIDENWIQGIVT
jgi:hypothetical protein